MTPRGSEHAPESSGKSHIPETRGSKSGNKGGNTGPEVGPSTLPEAPADPDLLAVVEAWAALPEAVRAGIVAMVGASAPGSGR